MDLFGGGDGGEDDLFSPFHSSSSKAADGPRHVVFDPESGVARTASTSSSSSASKRGRQSGGGAHSSSSNGVSSGGGARGAPPKRPRISLEPAVDAIANRARVDSAENENNLDKLLRAKRRTIGPGEIATMLKDCVHEVTLPQGTSASDFDAGLFDPAFPAQPCREYPFVLDPFQRTSIACLERDESVLVSAHTSAGKTVVAEYAISMGLRDNQRVIYTSPIKALSNQKYRELYEEFQDVGLMTGDVTINPNASCLVMTTEILRSMLYRGSEIMREVKWVIFDEIHYMRDAERGVVWEETIILLPDRVRYVFLSATIPNAQEFASWVGWLHTQPVHVVYTEYRPTPLQHYIFPSGGDGLHLVVDDRSNFLEQNFQRALASLGSGHGPSQAGRSRGGRRRGRGGPGDCYKIVKMIMELGYDPVIAFAFSKKECEALALQMAKLDFNDEEEKGLVDSVFNNAIDSLSDDDKALPQVEHILPLLKRGIGIHHSGLLPILKEVIEILFQEGLVKVLFATETFAMGLNMPAKTVVFTSVRKFDGTSFRNITSGEYIQMSGRAGRRGLDDRGIVILMVDEKLEPAEAKGMLLGSAEPLYSSFHLGYNMLLNLLRVEEVDPEYIMKRSFLQFQNTRRLPDRTKALAEVLARRKAISIPDEEVVAEYHDLRAQLDRLGVLFRDTINQPLYSLPFLQPGRLVRVREDAVDWGWGVVVNFQKRGAASSTRGGASEALVSTMGSGAHYVVDVLLHCRRRRGGSSGGAAPPRSALEPCGLEEDGGVMQVVPVLLPLLDGISSIRVYIPKDLRAEDHRQSVRKTLKELHKRFPDGVPLLDPVEDMKVEDETFRSVVRKMEALEDRLESCEAFRTEQMKQAYEAYVRKVALGDEAKELKRLIRQSDEVVLKEELKRMKRVLRRLGFTDRNNLIQTKGRVGCEINASDGLLLTELMFNGVLNELTPNQIVAVVSTFVFEQKSDGAQSLAEDLSMPLRQLKDTARRVAEVVEECRIPIDVDAYVEKFKPHMMEIVYAWCNGARFADICKMTNVFEGSIIRCMRRLEELLRQLSCAAKAIGNSELESRFATGITSIKRDIVFAVSLYL